jgi:hypothetical protein
MFNSTTINIFGLLLFGASLCGGCASVGLGIGFLCGHDDPVQCASDAMTIPVILIGCIFLLLLL